MKKKTVWVIGLILFTIVLACIFTVSPISSVSAAEGGTCCDQEGAWCVIPPIVIEDAYYLPSGPCPKPEH